MSWKINGDGRLSRAARDCTMPRCAHDPRPRKSARNYFFAARKRRTALQLRAKCSNCESLDSALRRSVEKAILEEINVGAQLRHDRGGSILLRHVKENDECGCWHGHSTVLSNKCLARREIVSGWFRQCRQYLCKRFLAASWVSRISYRTRIIDQEAARDRPIDHVSTEGGRECILYASCMHLYHVQGARVFAIITTTFVKIADTAYRYPNTACSLRGLPPLRFARAK